MFIINSNNYCFNCVKAFLLKKLLFSSEKSSWRDCPGMIAVFYHLLLHLLFYKWFLQHSLAVIELILPVFKQVDFLNFPQALGSRHLRSGAEAVFRTWPRFGAELCHREVWQPAPQWVGNLVVGEIPAGREVPPFPWKLSVIFMELRLSPF